MVTALTANNFFSKYIADPFSNELSNRDKAIAVIAMSILTLLTFSLIISLTSYLRNRKVTQVTKETDNEVTKRVNSQAIIAIQQALANNRNIKTTYDALDEKTRKAVTELNLKEIDVSGSQLHELAEIFPNTQSIALAENNLTALHLQSLNYYNKLITLDLSVPPASSLGLEDEHIKNLRPLFGLKMLNLNGNKGLTGASFASLPEALTTLFIADCRISDQGIQALSKHKLECLTLDNNTALTGATFSSLNRSLQRIRLVGCNALIPEHVKNLTCKHITLPIHINK